MTDHDWTDRAARAPFDAQGKNEHRPEVELLLRHLGQMEILDLVHAGVGEVMVVDAEGQPRIVAMLLDVHFIHLPD